MGVDAVPNTLPESWESIPHTKLLAQQGNTSIQGKLLSLNTT